MRSFVRLALSLWLVVTSLQPADAAFTSLYVFGDGACTTTNNPFAGPYYYGLRRSNGRVWVEVLAQRQGLPFDNNRNWSFWGHYSSNLVANVSAFIAPPDVNTALFVMWVNDADFVDAMSDLYPSLDVTAWNNFINQSLTNHARALTNLYAKGARTLIMPNAVDITKSPYYPGVTPAQRTFIRQRITDFNNGFTTLLNHAMATSPGLTIHSPDLFSLLDNVVTNAAAYGLTNALYQGHTIDAISDPAFADKSLNGPGTNHIFWDFLHPTAKMHAVIADMTQQLIAPVRISRIVPLPGSNRLDIADVPIGRNGLVEGSTNFANWVDDLNFNSTNLTQSVFVPASDPMQFYRLRFPFVWTWP